jgi:hypothetical protein
VEAWTSRVEDQYKDVKCVVIFAHAASVIALGRAVCLLLCLCIRDPNIDEQLTGNKALDVSAGCATTSLYRRKTRDSTTTTHSSPCGVGEWVPVYLGRADYMQGGVERDWSFRDVLLAGGEVIHVSLDPPITRCQLMRRTTVIRTHILCLMRDQKGLDRGWTGISGGECQRRIQRCTRSKQGKLSRLRLCLYLPISCRLYAQSCIYCITHIAHDSGLDPLPSSLFQICGLSIDQARCNIMLSARVSSPPSI